MSAQTQQISRLIYTLGVQHGLPPARAKELVAAAYEESHLNPKIDNRAGSGASGLFQLLSSGYRQRAQKLGGVYNPRANTLAILPAYVKYWRTHPGARPGEGAAAVEASGEGVGFYAKDLHLFDKVGGGAPAQAGALAAGRTPAPSNTPTPNRHELAQQLVSVLGSDHPDVGALIPLVAAAKVQPHVDAKMQTRPHGRAPAPQATSEATTGDARVVASAKKWLGAPYVYGGTGKGGIDCSALLQRVWGDAGVKIARTTYDQWKQGTAIGVKQLRAGDAVFFRGSDAHGSLPGHVGVYIGGGRFIEAPHTGAKVRVSKLAGRSDFVGARRYG